jgi:hypothetical protein
VGVASVGDVNCCLANWDAGSEDGDDEEDDGTAATVAAEDEDSEESVTREAAIAGFKAVAALRATCKLLAFGGNKPAACRCFLFSLGSN